MTFTMAETRLDVLLPSGDQHCAAWLYLPAGSRPAPGWGKAPDGLHQRATSYGCADDLAGRLAGLCEADLCVCETDSAAPAKATLRHVSKAPPGQINRYEEGHFAVYVDGDFERVTADQINFLRQQVPLLG